jgi:hypothetical protein
MTYEYRIIRLKIYGQYWEDNPPGRGEEQLNADLAKYVAMGWEPLSMQTEEAQGYAAFQAQHLYILCRRPLH